MDPAGIVGVAAALAAAANSSRRSTKSDGGVV
jgi:hypothetical protein